MVREYADGVLVREDGISVEQLDAIFGPLKSYHKKTRITRKPKTKVGGLCFGANKDIMEQLENPCILPCEIILCANWGGESTDTIGK